MWKLSTLIAVVIVTNCAISSSHHVEAIKHFEQTDQSSLHHDLCDFLNLIPIDDIRNLTKHFYANDADMRASYDYLRGEGYQKIVESLSQISILKKFMNFLNDTGVNFAELNKKIEKIVLTNEETDSIAFVGKAANSQVESAVVNEGEIAASEAAAAVAEVSSSSGDVGGTKAAKTSGLGGINAFFSETLLLVPQDEVLTLFFAKMQHSNAFSSFLAQLSTADYENLFENLKQSPRIQILYYELKSHGIDVLECGKSLKGFVGY